jgi:hypothetical protein
VRRKKGIKEKEEAFLETKLLSSKYKIKNFSFTATYNMQCCH